jgi:transcriptional repressor NrdR
MDELKKLDAVAYIRYASVYRDFGTADDFEKFVDKL